MQIVLLSGGSGKRLWPLSNNTRSKQFLQLLQSPDGKPESMVQRFTEKPNEAKAEELLSLGAYWNGGVFAFRLGYMMNIVKKYIVTDSFATRCIDQMFRSLQL